MATIKQYENKRTGEKLWLFKTYLGIDPITGKQITTTRRGFKTKKEAILSEKRLQVEFKEGGNLKKQVFNTFEEIYLIWFDTYKKTVRETTYLGTQRKFRLHILPVLGQLKIEKISIKEAQKALNLWSDNYKEFKSLLQYSSSVMELALNMDLITKNPFRFVSVPKAKEKVANEIKCFTSDQVKTMLNYLEKCLNEADSAPRRYKIGYKLAIFRLLAFSGLRASEALALNWEDINFKDNSLTVNKTLTTTKKGMRIGAPKTRCSNRTIALDSKTIYILKKWKLSQKEILFSNRINKNDIVFCELDGTYGNYNSLSQKSEKLALKLKLPPLRSHAWRHTHASMLFEAGVSMKEVQERLGHSSIKMTMDIYTHLSQEKKIQTVEKLEKFASF